MGWRRGTLAVPDVHQHTGGSDYTVAALRLAHDGHMLGTGKPPRRR